jgi:hypothetical protein
VEGKKERLRSALFPLGSASPGRPRTLFWLFQYQNRIADFSIPLKRAVQSLGKSKSGFVDLVASEMINELINHF